MFRNLWSLDFKISRVFFRRSGVFRFLFFFECICCSFVFFRLLFLLVSAPPRGAPKSKKSKDTRRTTKNAPFFHLVRLHPNMTHPQQMPITGRLQKQRWHARTPSRRPSRRPSFCNSWYQPPPPPSTTTPIFHPLPPPPTTTPHHPPPPSITFHHLPPPPPLR